jgi:hypothetical protein
MGLVKRTQLHGEFRNPEANGYAKRLMRTIRQEEIDLCEYRDYADAYGQLGRFPNNVYHRKRVHLSLGYFTPMEAEQQWLRRQKATTLIRAVSDTDSLRSPSVPPCAIRSDRCSRWQTAPVGPFIVCWLRPRDA